MGRLNNSNMGSYSIDPNDIAKDTMKQTTIINNYISNPTSEINAPLSHQASNNMCIDDRREISTYNRAPNGKADLNSPYIDEENVKFNENRDIYTYVPNPKKNLDYTITELPDHYDDNKLVLKKDEYSINPSFINTLNNNDLVNDIFHPKNY